MGNNEKSTSGLQTVFTDSMQMIADTSASAMKMITDNLSGNVDLFNKAISATGLGTLTLPFGKKTKSNCCPPEEECPPHCILQITKRAHAGERIIIPFLVKNNCNSQKTYRIGLRELKDIDGNIAPSQPYLNKNKITLEPGSSEQVLLGLDLGQFTNGNIYTAEIVLREKDINQNICFKLIVERDGNIPVAEPQDEKKYRLRWQSWKSHFYCEPGREARISQVDG